MLPGDKAPSPLNEEMEMVMGVVMAKEMCTYMLRPGQREGAIVSISISISIPIPIAKRVILRRA